MMGAGGTDSEYDAVEIARRIVARLSTGKRETLAVAESLTCGRVQAAIGAVSGASAVFLGGVTAYSIEQKALHLGVDATAAAPCEAVSARVAREMARGACRMFGSDWAIATTGFAEPRPEQGRAEPVAFFAVARGRIGEKVGREADVVAEQFAEFPGAGRVEAQRAVVVRALMLLEQMLGTTGPIAGTR
jgi:nicotinamide-nucleotide amidase